MLAWLARGVGFGVDVVERADAIAASAGNGAVRCAAIRKFIPWTDVATRLSEMKGENPMLETLDMNRIEVVDVASVIEWSGTVERVQRGERRRADLGREQRTTSEGMTCPTRSSCET
jgi:hypothetical protein